jgi:hypothetical protein
MTKSSGNRRKLALAGVKLAMVAGMVVLAQCRPASAADGTNQTPTQPPAPAVKVIGFFRPLNKELRDGIVAALKALPAKYGTNRPPILFNYVAGNSRLVVSREMMSMLKQAGLDAQPGDTDLLLPMPADSLPQIFIKCNDSDIPYASDLSEAFIGMLPQKIPIVRAPEWAPGRIGIFILGDPVFSATGAVTFN